MDRVAKPGGQKCCVARFLEDLLKYYAVLPAMCFQNIADKYVFLAESALKYP